MYKQLVIAFVAMSLSTACANSDSTSRLPTMPGNASVSPELAHATATTRLPTCTGAGDCAAGALVCTGEDQTTTIAPTVITDYSIGLSSDGHGPYVQGANNVRYSLVSVVTTLHLEKPKGSAKTPRTYTINLNNPVPGGGGVPLGSISDNNDINIETQWYTVNNARQNLHNIPIGSMVTADQIDVTFHINGRFHILQMGPQAYGHCHVAPTAVFGAGTSSGTITRVAATKWVLDLPAGSIGRLFDLYNTDQYAVDKGLYYTQLHFEIGN